MTTTATITPETLTTGQIRALRDDAAVHGDLVMVDICNVALSGEDSDGTGTTIGTPCSLSHAQLECTRVLNEARAQ